MRRARRWRCLAFCIAASASVLLPAAAAAQAPPGAPELVDLRFRGADAFSSTVLAAAIMTRATGCRVPAFPPVCWLGLARDRQYLDERVLEADVLRLRLFYHQRGYRNARVEVERHIVRPPDETEEDYGAVRIVFRIAEPEPVRVAAVEITGANGILAPNLERTLPIRAGGPFNLLAYEASRDTIIGLLRNDGYAHADILVSYFLPADPGAGATIEYQVLPGPRARFGEIRVVGNERVSDAVVRRMLTFGEGELYRHNEVWRSQQNLFGLAIFRHVEIRTGVGGEEDSIVPVTVQVNEGDAYRVRLGAGMSTADCASAEGRWISRNFIGGGRRLEVRGQIANVLAEQLGTFPCFDTGTDIYSDLTGSVAADFTQPWFFSAVNTLRTGLFVERRSLPDVFVRTSRGGYVSVARALDPRTSVEVGYRPELSRLKAEGDLFFCVNFVACEAREIEVLREAHWLAPVGVRFARDRSNALFDPTRGYIVQAEAEHASGPTGSDFGFTRLVADASVYRDIRPGVIVAARLRPGWAGSARGPAGLGLYPQKRFFAGGPNSVRGFGQHRLGPKVLPVDAVAVLAAPREEGGAGCDEVAINTGTCDPNAVDRARFGPIRAVGGTRLLEGSLELRFPVFRERVQGAAFMDFGQVWGAGADASLGDLAWTPGAGVRVRSPIGPIRVDLGYNPGLTELVRVITSRVDRDDDGRLVDTGELKSLDLPYLLRPGTGFLDRLQLHISIGQAF